LFSSLAVSFSQSSAPDIFPDVVHQFLKPLFKSGSIFTADAADEDR
jgi:hypothetical protein